MAETRAGKWKYFQARQRMTGRRGGFTLVELMVVTGIMLLVMATAVPSIMTLFSSGAEAQAYNVFAAQLTAARALAIRSGTYAAVHVQMGDVENLGGACFVAVLWDDPGTTTREFDLAPNHMPRKIPGGIAFGQLSTDFIGAGGYIGSSLDTPNDLEDFTTFTVVFSPIGSVVKQVAPDPSNPYGGIWYTDGNLFFAGSQPPAGTPALWHNPGGQAAGAAAVAMFSYSELRSALPNCADYLEANAPQYIPINFCTGQLFSRAQL